MNNRLAGSLPDRLGGVPMARHRVETWNADDTPNLQEVDVCHGDVATWLLIEKWKASLAIFVMPSNA
eukprot:3511488-Amphidinium_carterae.1